ncbi:hypothetical protein Ssi03_77360 [Sphaerisporangium siamense]|uniref:Uncharacterized protein n=1 Tax=Sphaerisporangium siamense TaxID=795645 RepID=A0A7W7DIU9_9ACTN|nr:hypothetical protein [Sphaerisporangium siamense]MBB4706158.1 hypothetical protein [Sphaerisporangium siamense]GII89746.1 hypothetical protein Ssi03_77360 [Sphaerisporangium siamense]
MGNTINSMYGPGEHEDRATSLAYENPEIAKVFAILALASAVNRLAEAHEQAHS